jgi:hypothetical protein
MLDLRNSLGLMELALRSFAAMLGLVAKECSQGLINLL